MIKLNDIDKIEIPTIDILSIESTANCNRLSCGGVLRIHFLDNKKLVTAYFHYDKPSLLFKDFLAIQEIMK